MTYALLIGPVFTQSPSLRVCRDPDNLPFSNEKLEGFENKIAAVIAAELGATPTYAWWPHQRGLVRNTIDAGTCDVIFGVPEGLDFVLWTKPYYRSSYVMAYRNDRGYDFRSLDAPELKQLRIAVYTNTPPEESLARRGLLDNVSTYSLFFDPRGDQDRPGKLLDDLVEGTVDVAIPWGPLAGYTAKMLNAPLELVPLEDEPGVPLSFDISMGVEKGNQGLKSQLEAAIDRRQAEILAILEEYGVPLIPHRRRIRRREPERGARVDGRGVAITKAEPVCWARGHGRGRQDAIFSGWLSGLPRRRRRRDGCLGDRRQLEVRQRRRGAVQAHQGRDPRADDAGRLRCARGRGDLENPVVHPFGLRRRPQQDQLVTNEAGLQNGR